MSVSSPDAAVAPSSSSHLGAIATILVLFIVTVAAALSVDVVRGAFGIKGDEATYVSMALSAAFDHDLTYERKDLDRFVGLYRSGPEGIFLKRGRQFRVRLDSSSPFVHVTHPADPRSDRLFFGKAFIYPVVAAPFVRLFGLNGFYVLHACLLCGVLLCGYTFLAAQSRGTPALTFALAFVGATVVPVYTVFLTSDLFNFAVVFFAFFLWLYKEVAPQGRGRFIRSSWSDLAAAVLLGVATFSKPINAPLIAPLVLLLWWRRRFWAGLIVGVVFTLATVGLFGVNAASSGEFNYQGGDRKTFYGTFPFETQAAAWEQKGTAAATNDADTENVLQPSEFANRFGLNVEYFFLGRHFGFVPYFFPGFVGLCLWLVSAERRTAWRFLTFMAVAVSTVVLLVFFPYSWSGGGGPPGNRYFLSLYPGIFFLTPPLTSIAVPLFAWIGGALFTAQMLVNPFVAAKFTYLNTERGLARRLPVELTMAQDLPVMLSTSPIRGRIPYGYNPTLLLYFLDQNAYPPEPGGMWVSGGRRADIIVRSEDPIGHLAVTAVSPIRTTLTMSFGAASVVTAIAPNVPMNIQVPARGVRAFESYAYLLSAESSEGFTPHLVDPSSGDFRNLGVSLQFRPVK